MIGYDMKLLLVFCITVAYAVTVVQSVRSYTAVLEKIETIDGDKDYFHNVKLKATKFNRTVSVINGTFELVKDVPLTTLIDITTYQKYGTEYKKSVAEWHNVTLCSFIETDHLLYPDLVKTSSLPSICPFVTGAYYVKNFVMNEEQLPQYMPGGNWRIDVRIFDDDKLLVLIKMYVKIVHSMMKTNGIPG